MTARTRLLACLLPAVLSGSACDIAISADGVEGAFERQLTVSGPLEFTFAGDTWSVPGYMVWAAFIYAVVGTMLTYFVGRPLEGQRLERHGAVENGVACPENEAHGPFAKLLPKL